MSPPAARQRDELVTVLLERLDRFEATLSGMRDAITRMEQVPHDVSNHEMRITALEALRHQAEGAAKAGRLLWLAVAAVGAAFSTIAHYVLR